MSSQTHDERRELLNKIFPGAVQLVCMKSPSGKKVIYVPEARVAQLERDGWTVVGWNGQ